MDSGIYRLTYKTGETYVGKSIHLTTRWKQHFDKLSKGKAAKNMQDAYHASGNHFPKTEVLLYCHPDMLDYYEGYFINHLRPPLNTAIPVELSDHAKEVLVDHANNDRAQYSVVAIIEVLNNFADNLADERNKNSELVEQAEELECEYEELSAAWGDRAKRDNWANREYRAVVAERDRLGRDRHQLEKELATLKSWQLRVERATWWQRLWASW